MVHFALRYTGRYRLAAIIVSNPRLERKQDVKTFGALSFTGTNNENCLYVSHRINCGERYFVRLVPRDTLPPNADMSGFKVDAVGNVLADFCLVCKETRGVNGREMTA